MHGERIFRSAVRDEKVIAHTERVVGMCADFSDKLGMSHDDTELLINATWLHDIAKGDYGEAHNMPENVKNAVENAGYHIDEDNVVLGVICAHKGKFSPKCDLALISAVLRICDKLDKFNKKAPDAMIKSELAVSLAKNVMPNDEYDKLRNVYDEYINKYLLKK